MATVAVALALAVVAGGGVSASPLTVAARGGEQFVPNALIQSTFRFSPGPIGATTGQTLTWVDADQVADEPHTITVVTQADLPTDIEDVFECQASGPCGAALAGHFGGADPVPVLEAGSPGLDAPGDSLLLFPGGSVDGVISASAGTTLYYLCALHPWMLGSISVG
ncbi:MAG: cupredoxin domain-containing protein [Actinomycetota bacterium]